MLGVDMNERLKNLEKVLQGARSLLPGRQHVDLQSRALRWAEYDRRRRILQVEFQNGSQYEYGSIEPRRWRELMQSSSRGRYFVHQIRGSYPFRKIS